jgi:hypothetical protein
LLAHILNREPANYLLVGGRQLGKSSLLKAIERRYRKRGSLDCRYCSVGDMPIQVVLAQTLGLSEDADMVRVVRELGGMPNGQRRLMLLDECDVFLAAEEEKGFETLSAFRSLSEEGRCFFILAGFWRLFEAASLDYQSRIRNFGETLTIGALEAEACRELITKPMAALNLEYVSDILVERIIQETGRRANLVAVTCNEILAGLGREASTISEADVVRALTSPAVGDALSGWENLAGEERGARLDRTIIYATARRDRFLLRDVLAVLDDANIAVTTEEVRRSLRRLDLAFIIGEEGGRYRYRVPLFQRMIHQMEADLLLERELREARSEAQPASVTSHPRARDKA